MRIAYLLTFSFVLAILLSSAVLADFSITTEDSKETVCIGSTAVIVDKVSGTSEKSVVTVSGTATEFATTVPTEFTGTSQNIYSYITLSSKTKQGNYGLTVKVTSGNSTKEQYHEITAKDCHGTSLVVDGDKKACPCEKVKYKLTLENQGEFSEEFKISVDGTAKAWTNLSIDSADIDSGESKDFYAYVEPPCNVDGDYTLTFKAVSEESLAGASAAAKLEILPCYEYDLNLEKNYSICENEKLNIPIKIDNKGTADNTFSIVLEGPAWAKLSAKSFEVESETEKGFEINAQPPFKTEGNFTLKIETMTAAGNVKKNAEVSVKVRRCYGIKVDLKDGDKLCKEKGEYEVTLTNLGEFDSKYSLKLNGPEWAELSDNKIDVDANANRTAKLKVEPKDAEHKKYNITVTATDTESNDSDSKSIELELPKPEDCYKPELTSEDDIVGMEIEKSKTLFLMLKNNGFDDAIYNIELSGKGAKFAIINPNEVELKPGESETLYLYLSPPLFTETGEYNLTVAAEEKNSNVKAEKTIIIKLLEEGQTLEEAGENETAEEIPEKEPNIFIKIIDAIKSFFRKLFMVQQPASMNDTKIEEITGLEATNVSISIENETEAAEVAPEENVTTVTEVVNETEEIINVTEAEESNETEAANATAEEAEIEESNETEAVENETITAEVVAAEENETAEAAETAAETNESENIEKINNFSEKAGDLYKAYKNYMFGAGIIIIIILLIISGLGKSVIEFFEEEETPKNNKK